MEVWKAEMDDRRKLVVVVTGPSCRSQYQREGRNCWVLDFRSHILNCFEILPVESGVEVCFGIGCEGHCSFEGRSLRKDVCPSTFALRAAVEVELAAAEVGMLHVAGREAVRPAILKRRGYVRMEDSRFT